MTRTVRELFLHCQDAKPLVVDASLEEKLLDVLVRAGVVDERQNDVHVFVGECDEALRKPDDTEDRGDDHGPVDLTLPIDKLDPQHRHIHCYVCKYVDVDVNFGNRTEQRKFSPATTVGIATTWACRKFRLDGAAASDFVLRRCDTGEQPRPDKFLGELVQKSCSLCFNLAKELTPQG